MNALTPITAAQPKGTSMTKRGRPSGRMTQRRQQVLDEYRAMAAGGQAIRLAELARRCGLWSYNDARRIIRDLERMGAK